MAKKNATGRLGRALLLLLCIVASCPAVLAQSNAKLDQLADKILACELELQEINAHLHIEAANPSFKQMRRVWLWDVGNALPTEGGLIAATALFYSHANDKTVKEARVVENHGQRRLEVVRKNVPNRVPGSQVAATIIPQIAGQGIGASGALFELGADCSRSCLLHKHKLDGRTVTNKVVALKRQIDRLQSEYDATAAGEANVAVYQVEGRVLRCIAHKSLAEFVRLEGAGSQLALGRLIEDSASAARNSVGIVGNAINVQAVTEGKKRLNGQGAILNLISAAMITARPFVSNIGSFAAKKVSEHQARKNFPELQNAGTHELTTDTAELQAACTKAAVSASLTKRLNIYASELEKFADEDSLAHKEQGKSKQMVVRRFRETAYGPTKMAQSIMGIVIGFRKQNNATADNRLAATANVTYMSGQVFNICELVRERVIDESDHHKLDLANMLPEQRVQRHLQSLEKMQQQLHGD